MLKVALPLTPLLAYLGVGACATVEKPLPQPDGTVAYARLGQTAESGPIKMTPLKVLEDSRCPANVQCVWAGRVRISATIAVGANSSSRELTLNEPVAIADGTLKLVEVQPARANTAPIAPADYRFGFRFEGGY